MSTTMPSTPVSSPGSEAAAELTDFGAAFDQLAAELTAPAAVETPAAAAVETPAAAAAVETPAVAVAETPIYSVQEEAVLSKYREDWKDVHEGEALIRRKEYRELVNYIFAQVRDQLEPLQEAMSVTTSRTQYSDILGLVEDYDRVRDPAIAWVNTQPPYLKKAYLEVVQNGSPQDVADLITRFKKETNYTAPAAAAAAAAAPAAAATPAAPVAQAAAAPPDVKKAAAASALRVVNGGRSEQTQGPDPSDFDGAFGEFSKQA